MAHPLFYAALAFGGVVFLGMTLYEEYLENKNYEQFQRNRTRYKREFNRFHRSNNDFEFDDDREDEPAFIEKEDDPNVRKRRPFGSSSNSENDIERSIIHENDPDQYELSELETSIAERKRRLMAEQAFLDQEEENLRNRKNALMKNFDDVTSMDHTKFSSNSSSDNDEEHSLRNHMTVFDPFADQFQESHDNNVDNSLSNSDSTERMVIVDNTEKAIDQKLSSAAPLSSSTELRFPSPHHDTPPTSNATSVTDGEHSIARVSDSEESWDAVSEMEDWNQSSAYESDGEYQSHNSIASDSDEDKPHL